MLKRIFKKRVLLSLGLGLIFLLAMVFFVLSPVTMLSIMDISNGKTVFEAPAAPGDNLWIAFINSVEKLPVADHFVVAEDYRIRFTETIFQAPYAGYDRSETAELIAPGTLMISGYDRPMDRYSFYAGAVSRHMLFLNGNWLPLYDVARGGDLIEITLVKRSRLAYLLERMVSHE